MEFGKGVLIGGAGNIVNDFIERYHKGALYFTDIFLLPEDFAFVNDICRIYTCFFVSPKEAEYKKKYGSEKFEDLMGKSEVDVIDLDRESVL